MKVKSLSSSAWLELNSEHFTLVLSDLWAEASTNSYKRLGVYSGKNHEELVAVFAIYVFQKMGKTIITTPPAFPNCGLALLKSFPTEFKQQSYQKRVMRAISEYLTDNYSKAYIDIAFPEGTVDLQPFLQKDFEEKLSYAYTLNLAESTEDELLKNMSPERRKNIRDSLSGDFEVELNADHTVALQLVKSVLTDQGVAFHQDLLSSLLSSDAENVFAIGVYRGSELYSTSIIASDRKTAYYIAGGTVKADSKAGALSLWSAILEARKRGIIEFNFLGSSVPEIEKYFRGFGGKLVPYLRVRHNTALLDFLKGIKERIHG